MVKYNSVVSRDVIILLFENDSEFNQGLFGYFFGNASFMFLIFHPCRSFDQRKMLRGCRENDILQREE